MADPCESCHFRGNPQAGRPGPEDQPADAPRFRRCHGSPEGFRPAGRLRIHAGECVRPHHSRHVRSLLDRLDADCAGQEQGCPGCLLDGGEQGQGQGPGPDPVRGGDSGLHCQGRVQLCSRVSEDSGGISEPPPQGNEAAG